MTAIQVDLDSVKLVVAQNIVAALSTDEKNSLLQQAVDLLIAPNVTRDQYGRTTNRPSDLENAFQVGVRKIAFEVVEQVLSDGDTKKMVTDVIRTKVEESLKKQGSWIFEAIGQAIADKVSVAFKDH